MKRSASLALYAACAAAFLGLCGAAVAWPEHGGWVFPALAGVMLATAALVGSEPAPLMIIAATFLCGGLWRQWPKGHAPFIAAVVPLMWALGYAVHYFENRYRSERRLMDHLEEARNSHQAELRREMDYYRKRLEELKVKLSLRHGLSSCAKDLSSLFDPEAVQKKAVWWTEQFFGDSQVFLAGFSDDDPLDALVLRQHQSLLCDDCASDGRFSAARREPTTRSIAVSPIWVGGKIYGGLKVENPKVKRFTRDDLRILDAVSTLTSLSLDNAYLFRQIEEAAVRDGLTRLLTQRAFKERLQEELLKGARYRKPLSLLMLDVDHFKKVNDTHGHAAGDEVLARLAQILSEAARPVDVAARYGGEEFALVLVETDKDKARQTAESVRQKFQSERFSAGGVSFCVTLSIGVATCTDDATTSAQLIRAADERLYKAKTGGRNRVVGEGEASRA